MTQEVLEAREQAGKWMSSHPRIDGRERVTGRARYGADWKVPEMLYGRVILATVPHGIVKEMNLSRALSIPGVKAIITCLEDKTIWHAGERDHERRVFTDRVRFVGDCIGAVAAVNRKIAQEAVESIEVEYAELPPMITIEDAEKEGASKIWESGNVLGPLYNGFGDINQAFQNGDVVLERDYETSRVHNAQIELASSLAWWDGEQLTVVAGSQGVFGCREGLALDLGIPIEKIRVITKYKGGGFGGRINSMNYDVVAALLSRKAGRPVMVEYSRSEDFAGTHARWPSIQHLKGIANKKNGKLIGIDLRAFVDIGAYTRSLKIGTFVSGAEACYDCEAWRGEIYGVYTNTPVTGPLRAPPGPQSCFSAETFVDELAHEMRINPLEFRIMNAVIKPHREANLTSNGLKECLIRGSKSIGWDKRWRPPPSEPKRSGRWKGIGVAMASWHAWLGKGEAIIRLRADGTIDLYTGVVDIGTGAKTTMAMIASKILGVPLESVNVTWGDTQVAPYARGEGGSTTTTFAGTAVREAATRVKTRLLELAAAQFGLKTANALELDFEWVRQKDGRSRIRVSDLLLKAGVEVIEEHTSTEPLLPEHSDRLSFGAHFAEVEIDAETGQVSVNEYVAAHDSGEIVNRLTAESQVQGGVVMGLGMALSEKVIIDPNYGSMMNSSFMMYRLPNIISVPRIQAIFVDTKDPYGPKALAEVPTVPVAPAIGNAIFNASGVRLRKLPFTPESYLRAAGTI